MVGHGRHAVIRDCCWLVNICMCSCVIFIAHARTHICPRTQSLYSCIQTAVVVAIIFPPPPLHPPKSAFAYCRVVSVSSTFYRDVSLCVSRCSSARPPARAPQVQIIFCFSSFLSLLQGLPLASPVTMDQPVVQADFAQILIANQVPGSFSTC